MNVEFSVKWFGDQFNINMVADGEDQYSLKGCRIKSGANGEFISVPATKKQNGDWWRHAWLSDRFGGYILKLAKESMPQDAERSAIRDEPRQPEPDDDIPF